ncbi:hypothetical protein ACJQWK_04513 [Exserohilum turcicum]
MSTLNTNSSSEKPTSTRKRPWPRAAERADALKRQKTLLQASNAEGLQTPPKSPPKPSNPRGMRLTLQIPKSKVSKEEQRTLKVRKAAAERWAPKLQNPFPNHREIKEAYPCKLLRHYTGEAPAEVIRPQINKSARVDNLLKQFPVLSTSSAGFPNNIQDMAEPEYQNLAQDIAEEDDLQKRWLHYNMSVTHSEAAQKLAWQAFSTSERGRVGRGREAMVISGLDLEDLHLEKQRLPNFLPDWCKAKTGRYAEGVLYSQSA